MSDRKCVILLTRSRSARTIQAACQCVCLLLFTSLAPGSSWAQTQDNTTIQVNYVYAAQLGIGAYNVGGLSVNVFTLPLSITRPLRDFIDLRPYANNSAGWNIRFNFPVSFGLFDFSAIDPEFGQIDIDQKTLAVVPGLEMIAPLSDIFALKPFFDLGPGKVLSSKGEGASNDNFFLVYSTGIRSLLNWPVGEYAFSVGNGVVFAGNTELGGAGRENYWAIETGVQLRGSLGFHLSDLRIDRAGFANVEPDIGLYFVHHYFPNPLQFSRLRKAPLKVRNQFEFGLTLGSATPWELLWVADPEIGPSYIFGDELQVFLINFGFPF